ncbi:MAG: DUF1015 domain-containing protein [Treponema sp.]|nr:DUF1015 domain-containing protein [Treponema sp.]
MRERLRDLGISVPEIYLPREGIDYRKWAVIACDQYSSEREYWEDVAREVNDAPSTLRLIFPECFLEDSDIDQRILAVHRTMHEYLEQGLITSRGEAFVLVERTTCLQEKPRLGLIVAIDLEQYQYSEDLKTLIRPTEATIKERLPPRMRIRRGAPLELPHIMLLVDDPKKTLIEPLYERRYYLEKAYDFDLMQNSGHIRGWFVREDREFDRIAQALENLSDPCTFRARYSHDNGADDVLLFAVGDGNHSLATAKAIWEEIKNAYRDKPDAQRILSEHPARYALVELVNLHDEGLPFHPIHRVLFNIDASDFLRMLSAVGAEIQYKSNARQAFAEVDSEQDSHIFAFVTENKSGTIRFDKPKTLLAVSTIQEYIDEYRKVHPGFGIDFIHGGTSIETIGRKNGNMGIYLPPIKKESLFSIVVHEGLMPRKTFSLGEASEKRFYIESRIISPQQ